jgi:hypothetical protein
MVGSGAAGGGISVGVGVGISFACSSAAAFAAAFSLSGPANIFQNASTAVMEIVAIASWTSVHLREVDLPAM